MTKPALYRWIVAVAIALPLFVAARSALAYPFMLRHEYTGCAQCHVDPSGAGLLTLYGRAQSEVLLRSRYSGAAGEEDPSLGGLAFGLVPLPEKGIRAQADARTLFLHTRPPSPAPAVTRAILMQADVAVGLETERVRAAAMLGYVHEGAAAASVTHGELDRLVSRQHWIGWAFGADDAWLAKVGRINLPFGLRMLEHTLFVRRDTKTDINAAAQHGASIAYSGERLRGEAMAIVGNLQVSPADLRERGGAAYAELTLSPALVAGASTLVTHVDRSLEERVPTFRQAHGLFLRAAPVRPVVVLAEADLLVTSPRGSPIATGPAALLQVDVEPWQGLHLIATGELVDRAVTRTAPSYSGWLSVHWFCLPHVDVRVDGIVQSLGLEAGRADVTSVLGQVHAFL